MVSLSAALSNVFLFLLIFGLSATVPCHNLKRHISTHKRAMGLGLVIQYVFMPLLGLATVITASQLSSFTQPMGLLLLVVTSSPGGSFSNWWCSAWNADLALSVTMSTVSSLLSIVVLPANIFLYSYVAYGRSSSDVTNATRSTHEAQFNATNATTNHTETVSIVDSLDYPAIFLSLLIALAAALLGLLAGIYKDTVSFHVWCHRLGTWSGVALVGCLLVMSAGRRSDSAWWDQDPSLYVATLIPCVGGLLLSHVAVATLGTELTPPERVALVMESCYQNTSLATAMAMTMYAAAPTVRAQALAVPMAYGILEALLVGAYGWYAWKAGWTKAPVHASLWTVWTSSYEIEAPVHETDAHCRTVYSTESSQSSVDDALWNLELVDVDLEGDEEEQVRKVFPYRGREHCLPEPIIVVL